MAPGPSTAASRCGAARTIFDEGGASCGVQPSFIDGWLPQPGRAAEIGVVTCSTCGATSAEASPPGLVLRRGEFIIGENVEAPTLPGQDRLSRAGPVATGTPAVAVHAQRVLSTSARAS